jgi:hypothetical protein
MLKDRILEERVEIVSLGTSAFSFRTSWTPSNESRSACGTFWLPISIDPAEESAG